eukprot:3939965-Rhodomonas_salina.2
MVWGGYLGAQEVDQREHELVWLVNEKIPLMRHVHVSPGHHRAPESERKRCERYRVILFRAVIPAARELRSEHRLWVLKAHSA